ncbi:MAG: 4a-hydroxytetrahydrobiopterin dehydratase [bacterium]
MPSPAVLTAAERRHALTQLPDWRHHLGAMQAVYEADSVAAALALIQAIGAAAESLDHHPDVDWRYRHVFVSSSTHSVGGQVTGRDLELARAVTSAAAEHGARARPELGRSVELGIDTADPAAIAETWAAALGYRRNAVGDLVDPWRRLPSIWFQETEDPNPSRFHVDLTVEDSTADAVLDEITAAGGRRIDERFRPAFTVVADAQDNRLCVCTELGRDD